MSLGIFFAVVAFAPRKMGVEDIVLKVGAREVS